jgi:hypothetical protein
MLAKPPLHEAGHFESVLTGAREQDIELGRPRCE